MDMWNKLSGVHVAFQVSKIFQKAVISCFNYFVTDESEARMKIKRETVSLQYVSQNGLTVWAGGAEGEGNVLNSSLTSTQRGFWCSKGLLSPPQCRKNGAEWHGEDVCLNNAVARLFPCQELVVLIHSMLFDIRVRISNPRLRATGRDWLSCLRKAASAPPSSCREKRGGYIYVLASDRSVMWRWPVSLPGWSSTKTEMCLCLCRYHKQTFSSDLSLAGFTSGW